MLTERQENILKLITTEYIKSARPVGSKLICDELNCSSATVRNEMANLIIKLGYKLGIGGVLTFKNAHLKEVVDAIDLKYLVTETDCPYLSPVPNRGKRNEPANLVYIVDEIARIKNLNKEEVENELYNNALEILRINL